MCPVFWVPEGITPGQYHCLDYSKKDIDVLELGRRFESYHSAITGFLRSSGRVHLFETEKGSLVFPTRESFIKGLARTKISVCLPSSITHPERSGHVETMTIKYLQSMISKCLVLGKAPREMIELFGYNPVIEIDHERPLDQLERILNNFGDFVPLIERNFNHVREHHTWSKRWELIKENLNQF